MKAKRQSTHHGALATLCFLIVLGAGWMIGPALRSSPRSESAPSSESRYKGVVQLTPDHRNRCEEFELDNRSVTLTPKGMQECRQSSETNIAPQTGGSIGRVNGIASHFKSR